MKNRFRFPIILTLCLVLVWMTVIFLFSAQPADESSQTSSVFVDAYLRLFHPDFSSMSPEEQDSLLENLTFWIRKLGHFTEFSVLGFLLTLHFSFAFHGASENGEEKVLFVTFRCPRPRHVTPSPAVSVLSLVIGVLYAASDEFHQLFVEMRGPSVRDVGIDSLGVLAGLGAGLLIYWLIWYRKSVRKEGERINEESV